MHQGIDTKKNLRRDCQPALWTTVSNLNRQSYGFRYVFEGKPRERLFEYIHCDNTTSEELCNSIFKDFKKFPFTIENRRSQTMDGVANMSRQKSMCSSSSQGSSLCSLQLLH